MTVYVVYAFDLDRGLPFVYGVYRTEKQAEKAKEAIDDIFTDVKIEIFDVR